MKKKVLILGGSSDIGIELVSLFLNKDGYKVNLHFHSNSKAVKNLKEKCNLIKADLSALNYKNILKMKSGLNMDGGSKLMDFFKDTFST